MGFQSKANTMGEILALLQSVARLLNICVEVWIKCNDVPAGLS